MSQEGLPYIFRDAAAKKNSGLYRPSKVEGMIPEFREQYLRIHADALDPYDYPVLQENYQISMPQPNIYNDFD